MKPKPGPLKKIRKIRPIEENIESAQITILEIKRH